MDKILSTAEEYKTRVQREAQARYVSAEYHRHQDIVIGTYTEIVGAVVGTSIFAGLVSQLVGGSHEVHISSGLAWVVAILSMIAPVLTAVRKVQHNAEDAERHRAGMDYNNHLRRRIDSFLLKYADLDSAVGRREEALKEWEGILKEFDELPPNMPTLTDSAYRAADKKSQKEAKSGRGA